VAVSVPPEAAGSVPPHNLEAETSVLGAILLAEQALDGVLIDVRLDPGDFYRERHRLVFRAMMRLKEKAVPEPIDALTFHTALEYWKARKPSVLFLSLGETDEWAHAGKYEEYVRAALQTCKGKINTFDELPAYCGFYFTNDFDYDPEGVAKHFTAENKPRLKAVRDAFSTLESFGASEIEATLKATARFWTAVAKALSISRMS